MARDEAATSRTTTTIDPALQATAHAGDINIAFHNKTGGHGNDPGVRKSQMDQMMARAQIWAVCEINTITVTAARFAANNVDPKVQYYTWWTDPPDNRQVRGTGVALHVPKDLVASPPTPNDYVYKHKDGKALAINLTIKNTPFLIIIIHGPHTDKEYEPFMDVLTLNIAPPDPARVPIILGDFNFVEAPTLDCPSP